MARACSGWRGRFFADADAEQFRKLAHIWEEAQGPLVLALVGLLGEEVPEVQRAREEGIDFVQQ